MAPEITIDQVRNRTSAQSYGRGASYYRSGAITHTIRRGYQIEGRCQGSGYSPYRVRATLLESGGIQSASCSCPYDWGGDCKHIVALLLTYLHTPETFELHETAQSALMERSKEELVALIEQMLERYPDLQALVDRPSPAQQSGEGPVETEPFRREMSSALHDYGAYDYDDWQGHYTSPEDTIYSIMNAAQQFAANGDWCSASAIYRAVVNECLQAEDYQLLDDSGGILSAIGDVLEALAGCLDHDTVVNDESERRAILDTLLSAEIWDIDAGGYGLADSVMPETLLEYVKLDDIPAMRERIQAARERKAQSRYGEWGVGAYDALLGELDALDNVDPEITLQRLRENESYYLLFSKLIELGRADEAASVVADHLINAYERLNALPALVEAGREDDAIRLARESLEESYDDWLVSWLLDRYKAHGNTEAIFALQLRRMDEVPSVECYARLKDTAVTLGNWDSVRADVVHKLDETEQYPILTHLYLIDEEWDSAWETLAKFQAAQSSTRRIYPYADTRLELTVADKTRYAHPERAIAVYVNNARILIDHRGRENYALAASYLALVMELYLDTLGDESAWHTLITDIRETNNNLPALRDELNKAGL